MTTTTTVPTDADYLRMFDEALDALPADIAPKDAIERILHAGGHGFNAEHECAELRAENRRLREALKLASAAPDLLAALKPFAHPDLCAEMGGNIEGDFRRSMRAMAHRSAIFAGLQRRLQKQKG